MQPKHVPPGEGRRVRLYEVEFAYKLIGAETDGRIGLFETVVPAGTLVKPHRHSREDEFTVVLEGSVGVRLGDEEFEAQQGAYLAKPRGIPHALWNAASEPARILEILLPGGLEPYFEELAPVLEKQGASDEYYALTERYGLEIIDDWVDQLEARYGVKL